ncbi:hypothetical protein [Bifidobacterium sp. ESL0790]|uniref:hypothetical protein n=1 Tax=Bifidobacterium sp. ESL0790 TaxID=2983233 RepID=UPI0023FA35FA|nr:hypothetical protein [Bifidobacterium sp. ESL0790]WEV72127.1 hypothetical protein OZY47_06720 [Bifidobacterium sp. ESL0790]
MSIKEIINPDFFDHLPDDPVADVDCDALGCTCHIRLMEEDFDDLDLDRRADNSYDPTAIDADIKTALASKGWGVGSRGVQRGHVYCPRHAGMGVES